MKLSSSEYCALVRQDFAAFIEGSFRVLNSGKPYLPNWHTESVASALEKCRIGNSTRLIINQPPRSLKSHCASIAFPAFILGHDPTAQIICTSYGQDLSSKLAMDCRTLMSSAWYQRIFPHTRLSPDRQALHDFMTTKQGFRMATSVGGTLTGRGATFIIVDDPQKPEEALSESQRKAANDWFSHTLYSRLNHKESGRIIVIMQRLHEDDFVGHIQRMEPWTVLRFPAIAEQEETHSFQTPYGIRRVVRHVGEALHPERESLEALNRIRDAVGEYNFAGQYQQAPAPLGGGLVKTEWFKTYLESDLPTKFDLIFQSWDTANKATELSDYSVCTTWGVKDKHLYLLHVFHKRLDYPSLKRAVNEQKQAFSPQTILIEDKSSGTALIQDLVNEGMHEIKRYEPTVDKIMRLNSVTSMIENGFVHLPEKAAWLAEYIHELTTFPNARFDDQADSTSQGLDWFKQNSNTRDYGLIEYYKQLEEENAKQQGITIPKSMQCRSCNQVMNQRIPGGLRCTYCGAQWVLLGHPQCV